MKYGAILCDPPWSFNAWSGKGKGRCPDGPGNGLAERHYKTLSLDDIKALPVPDLAEKDCALFMWVVDSQLPEAIDLGRWFGFTYKTVAFTWTKKTKHGKDHLGMGYWTRCNPEMCLLFTRGKPKRKSASVRQWIQAEVREHSRKPDLTYGRIEDLVAGPYLEMFARQQWPGWDSWGNETDKFKPKDDFAWLED